MKAARLPLLLFILLVAGCRNVVIEGKFYLPAEATALAIPAATTSTPDPSATAAIERAVRLTLTAAPSPTHIPPPFLRAFPEGDFVDGWYWPVRQKVYLEINDLVFVTTAGNDGRVEFFLAGHDLKPGDVLTMGSGDITVAHTVKQLFVAAFDLNTQTIAGTVDGQEVVHLWTVGADLKVDSDEHGNWLADFSGYDDPVLLPGVCGGAEAWGKGSSSTIVDWCVPPPTEPQVPTATATPAPGDGLSPITNLALNQSARVSNGLQSPSRMAVDGDVSTGWGAGDGAPQWIEIDLGAPATITRIRLLVTQHPYGDTLHRILVRSVNGDFSEAFRFEQYTYTGQWLVFAPEKPLEEVQIVRIETLSSPSWVGWLEIEVFGER